MVGVGCRDRVRVGVPVPVPVSSFVLEWEMGKTFVALILEDVRVKLIFFEGLKRVTTNVKAT